MSESELPPQFFYHSLSYRPEMISFHVSSHRGRQRLRSHSPSTFPSTVVFKACDATVSPSSPRTSKCSTTRGSLHHDTSSAPNIIVTVQIHRSASKFTTFCRRIDLVDRPRLEWSSPPPPPPPPTTTTSTIQERIPWFISRIPIDAASASLASTLNRHQPHRRPIRIVALLGIKYHRTAVVAA